MFFWLNFIHWELGKVVDENNKGLRHFCYINIYMNMSPSIFKQNPPTLFPTGPKPNGIPKMSPPGFEPGTFRSEGRCTIHCTIRTFLLRLD